MNRSTMCLCSVCIFAFSILLFGVSQQDKFTSEQDWVNLSVITIMGSIAITILYIYYASIEDTLPHSRHGDKI